MAEIVISEFMDEAAILDLRGGFDVLYDSTLVDHPEALHAALVDCRALIVRNRTQVRADILAMAPMLRVVGRLGVGLDNIDSAACAARGIQVFPATGANDLSVAEYVITAALMLLRGAWLAHAAMLDGAWPRAALMGRELAGKTMGLVGLGSIAREVAKRATALGMEVAAFDPFLPAADRAWDLADRHEAIESLLERSDVVSLHVPLTAGTRHLIDAARLHAMRRDAILVNAARGGVVDEPALASALKAGRIGGAALDVFEQEPLTRAGAEIFRGCPDLILTPHIAGVTVESNVRVSSLVARKVREALAGGPT